MASTCPAAQSIVSGPFLFRSGFLSITAILASYLWEQAHNAEAALEERLRQARLINEASGMLGASLDLQSVLEEVAAAACHLFDSGAAVLLSTAHLEAEAPDSPRVALYPRKRLASHDELEATIGRYAARDECAESGHAVHLEHMPGGRRAVVLSLAPSSGHTASTTIALSLPDGRRRPVFDEQLLDSFVERIRLAIENALLYRTLERSVELQHAYADLAKAHDQLLSVDEMKTSFLANVSHELRTPLNSIRAFSELLLTYEDPEVQREFLETINSESERLTRLVNDVLDLVKIEAGRMDWRMRVLDVACLIEECARAYAPLIQRRGLDFQLALAGAYPPVRGDWDRLQQVLGNLLNNAAKFTSEGSIRLGARRLGDEVAIYVADTGVGIAPENQARIFDKFQQVGDTLTEKPKGTGLGLPICQEIVTHHGGRIWVESELGVGSTFRFTLPLASRSAETESPERAAETAIARA